jgi:hypothetical protein
MLICVRVEDLEESICDAYFGNQGRLGLQLSLQRLRQRSPLRQPTQLQREEVAARRSTANIRAVCAARGVARLRCLSPGTRSSVLDEGTTMATNEPARTAGETRLMTAVQKASLLVGAAFLLVGVLGFIPGITTDYDTMMFAGHESSARLLGIFEVSILHNIVHLAFGVAGLLMARTYSGARGFLIGGGAIYLVLWIYGLVIDHEKPVNFVPVNTADNWLHFALGAAMVLLGMLLTRSDVTPRQPANRTPPDHR